MKTVQTDILIIGAGLTGLTLAYHLEKHNCKVSIVEARNRVGGRIFTKQQDAITPMEMGATWFSPHHSSFIKLLKELDVKAFRQFMGKTAIYEAHSSSPFQNVPLPTSGEPSFRILDGTRTIIDRLKEESRATTIYTNQKIHSIDLHSSGLMAKAEDTHYKASIVISTLPPLLFSKSIVTTPALPKKLIDIANQTHIWMGDAIKIALSYTARFWKNDTYSGTLFSNAGPIIEMYDHSNLADNRFALMGFLNGAYFDLNKAERLTLILNQLEKYYGPAVRDYTSYEELVWKKEPFSNVEPDQYILPHGNNGNPVFQQSYLDNHLYLGGTETSVLHGGYMEGAVNSANTIYKDLKNNKWVQL